MANIGNHGYGYSLAWENMGVSGTGWAVYFHAARRRGMTLGFSKGMHRAV
jgi:hypothetical protein